MMNLKGNKKWKQMESEGEKFKVEDNRCEDAKILNSLNELLLCLKWNAVHSRKEDVTEGFFINIFPLHKSRSSENIFHFDVPNCNV